MIESFKKHEQVVWIDRIYHPAWEGYVRILKDRAKANSKNGSIEQSVKDMLLIEKLVYEIDKTTKLSAELYVTLNLYAIQAGDYELSRRCIDGLKEIFIGKVKTSGFVEFLAMYYGEGLLYLHTGEYEKAISMADKMELEDRGLNTTWKGYARLLKAEAFVGLGEGVKARAEYEKAMKRIDFSVKDRNSAYLIGLIALSEKDYQTAVSEFTKEINYNKRYYTDLSGAEVITKHRYYTKRAEAYIGLNDNIKAKTDFETALIYLPSYEPAFIGLAKLEGKIVTDRVKDKVPPQIILTEPALSRGLKVTTAGSELMIKGRAIDPAGIKSVSVNGITIYSKEDGDFWGSVKLTSGKNQIAVKATDLAGNTKEEVFEIEKSDVITNDIVEVTVKPGKNYALIIGAQNYDDTSIPSLENPVADGIKLKLILRTDYNFDNSNIHTLFNPGKLDLRKKFIEITDLLQPEDNLVIFYAGHGIWVDKEKKGYWLLTDAKRNDVNTWLANRDVLDMIAKIPSRHTLLITDACFSGSLFKTRSIGADAPVPIREMSEKISRIAITSGNDTEVPDESVFMKYLVKALSENKEKYLTAQKMFITQIIEAVMTETKTEPRYGTLELAGHVGGDYIFIKK